jgi:hypothetical protein
MLNNGCLGMDEGWITNCHIRKGIMAFKIKANPWWIMEAWEGNVKYDSLTWHYSIFPTFCPKIIDFETPSSLTELFPAGWLVHQTLFVLIYLQPLTLWMQCWRWSFKLTPWIFHGRGSNRISLTNQIIRVIIETVTKRGFPWTHLRHN